MFDLKAAKSEAQKEIAQEKSDEAKEKIKFKLKQIDSAKLIIRNLERELEDLYVLLTQ